MRDEQRNGSRRFPFDLINGVSSIYPHTTDHPLPLTPTFTSAQRFRVADQGLFEPQQKKVFLLQDTLTDKKIIVFKTKIQVNTDDTYPPMAEARCLFS